MNKPDFRLTTSFAERLPGFYVGCNPMVVESPSLLQLNVELAKELGVPVANLGAEVASRIFAGQKMLAGAQPLAQAYAGHQFGGFVPQLGDGRALLLGEVVDRHGHRRDIVLKGSGPTAFSRGGDGKAAVGPVLREYLISEAMHTLGIPTTRALAAVATGENVMRTEPIPGAILTRVAASHIRVGTFQFFAARQLYDQVRQLADYVIERHYPELVGQGDRYLMLLKAVVDRQAALLAQWMLVGFIHGVMNTDNMSISGETIDYGPCAFMESTNRLAVFSSIDTGGRYAYGNQPSIARWNLARFAETLLPLVADSNDADNTDEEAVAAATDVINDFGLRYEQAWLSGSLAKLGLSDPDIQDDDDASLVHDWFDLLKQNAVDYTLAWRRLADAAEGNSGLLEQLFPSAEVLQPWLQRWQRRHGERAGRPLAEAMRDVNPIYIPRNHLVEEALKSASDDADLTLFAQLLDVTSDPFTERPGLEAYAEPASREFTACYKTFCGT